MISITNNIKRPPEAEGARTVDEIQRMWLFICVQAYFEVFIMLEIYLPSLHPEGFFTRNKGLGGRRDFSEARKYTKRNRALIRGGTTELDRIAQKSLARCNIAIFSSWPSG